MIYGGWRLSELEDALTELKNTLERGVLVVGEDELYFKLASLKRCFVDIEFTYSEMHRS